MTPRLLAEALLWWDRHLYWCYVSTSRALSTEKIPWRTYNMLFCIHVEFVFMLVSFTWLTDDLLKDNPPSKFGWSISVAQICLFCEKDEKPRNLGMRRQKSPLLKWAILDPSAYGFGNARVRSGKLCTGVAKLWLFGPHTRMLFDPTKIISTSSRKSCAASVLEMKKFS